MEKLEGIELIIFDMEVYKYDWVAGFKIHNTQEYIQIHNNRTELIRFLNEHRESIFFTINGESYDDNILNTILKDNDPYVTSQLIINKRVELKCWDLPILTYDLSKQKTFYPSLKAFESNNGMSIEELPITATYEEKLNDEELEILKEYNRHDLDATELSMLQRMPESIMVKARLIKYFKLDFVRWMPRTKVSIIAQGLGAKKGKFPHQSFSFDGIYSTLDLKNEKLREHLITENFYKEDLVIEIAGIKHLIRKGGIHASIEGYYEAEDVWHADFGSFYPSLMIEYDLLSRALGENGRPKFIKVRTDRYAAKAAKSPDDAALKEALNSVFGAANSEYSALYDPSRSQLVCMYGQAFAIDLTEKLEPYVNMIQSNTDGIIFKLKDPSYEQIMRNIIKEFEDRTRLKMDLEHYEKIAQKDVNNYVALHEGKIISRGGMTLLWDLTPDLAHYRGNYRLFQMTVLHRALTLNLMYGKSIREVVQEEFDNKNWFRFQGTSKIGSMYHKVTLSEEHLEYYEGVQRINAIIKDSEVKRILRGTSSKKNPDNGFNVHIKDYLEFIEQYENDEFDSTQLEVLEVLGIVPLRNVIQEKETQHVNRVFASNDHNVTRALYKYKWATSKKTNDTKLSRAIIANLPDNLFIYNGDMKDFETKDMHKKIDLEWYIQEGERKLAFYKDPKTIVNEVNEDE